MSYSKSFFIVVIAAIFIIAGCNNNNNPASPNGSGGSATYIGTLANASESGALTLVFATAPAKQTPRSIEEATAIINVTGTIKINGSTIPLSGTFNTTNDSLNVSGGGYSFMGILSNGQVSGTYTGPYGSGGFTAETSSSSGSVRVYTGTYQQTYPGTHHGSFNLLLRGSTFKGITDSKDGLGGTLAMPTVTIYFSADPYKSTIATATMSNDSTSITDGSYTVPTDGGTETGTWTAQRVQ